MLSNNATRFPAFAGAPSNRQIASLACLGISPHASLAQVTAGFRILRTGPIQSFLFKRMAVSSSKCNGCLMTQLRKYFQGHGPDRVFLGSSVHLMRNGIELTLGVVRQIGALR